MGRRPAGAGEAGRGTASLYVNYFEVAHNPYEFLLELGQYRPGHDEASASLAIHTSLALAPPYAKLLTGLLNRAVSEHEKGHGPIETLDDGASPFDVVLHSLPEFEARARRLRAQARDGAAPQDPSPAPAAKGPTKQR